MALTNLCHFLICTVSLFSLIPFGWPHTLRLHAHCKLHQSVCTRCVLRTTRFIWINFFLPTNLWWHAVKQQKKTVMTDDCNCNPNIGIMYNLWVIEWLCHEAHVSEFYPWQNICDNNNMESLPSVTSLVTLKYARTKVNLRQWWITQPLSWLSLYVPALNWHN
jgi:hypothetical protein